MLLLLMRLQKHLKEPSEVRTPLCEALYRHILRDGLFSAEFIIYTKLPRASQRGNEVIGRTAQGYRKVRDHLGSVNPLQSGALTS